MSEELREFHIGDILSAATGIYCTSPDGFDGMYKLLHYMTGESPFTHTLKRFAEECKPYLREQLPWLKELMDTRDVKFILSGKNNAAGVMSLAEQYGEYHALRPIHFEDHEVIDPAEEFRQNYPDKEILSFDLSDDNEEPPSPYGDINWH